MKKAVLLVLLTASLAATAAAFSGSSNAGPDRVSAADRAQIRCGRTRTIGVAAPITGAAASIGSQQLRWAKFFVSRYNATHRRTKFRVVQGDTQLPTRRRRSRSPSDSPRT